MSKSENLGGRHNSITLYIDKNTDRQTDRVYTATVNGYNLQDQHHQRHINAVSTDHVYTATVNSYNLQDQHHQWHINAVSTRPRIHSDCEQLQPTRPASPVAYQRSVDRPRIHSDCEQLQPTRPASPVAYQRSVDRPRIHLSLIHI